MALPLPVAFALFFVFTALDALLLALYPSSVPKRDFQACMLGLILLLLAFSLDRPSSPTPRTRRFDAAFRALSMMEILFTIALPWALITRERFSRGGMGRDGTAITGHLLASHLFVFQTQIALECVIMMSPHRWLGFPYTVAANTYRSAALVTWWGRGLAILRGEWGDITGSDNEREKPWEDWIAAAALPTIATALWLYSSFVFLPFEWYPLLPNSQVIAVKEKEQPNADNMEARSASVSKAKWHGFSAK